MRLLPGPAEGAVAVTVTSLETTDPGDLVAAAAPPGSAMIVIDGDRAALSESFYRRVGSPWHWVDRLDWSPELWMQWADRPELHLIVCRFEGRDAGYAELEQQADGNVEIAYFGLVPEAMGQGIGRWWLATVIGYAWSLPGTSRVWVHTCDLDAPAALSTYRSRGLREFAKVTEWRLPEQ